MALYLHPQIYNIALNKLFRPKIMKKINRYSLALFLSMIMIGVFSCRSNNETSSSGNENRPDVVTSITTDNFNGGATITFKLPKSGAPLYVLAKYNIRDKVSRETRSSYNKNSLIVDGFSQSADYQITLYAVNREGIMSEPVTAIVHPKVPVYDLVKATTVISADFGGINIKALNPLKKNIGIVVTAFDTVTKAMEIQEQHFTKSDTVDFSLRGLSTTSRNFGVYVTDEWGNISDTLKANLKPLYEELLDKGKFNTYKLPSDAALYEGGGWTVDKLWDGQLAEPGWHTNSYLAPPFVCTFSIGKTYKLTHFTMWGRQKYEYGHGNPKDFSIWGSNKIKPRNATLPVWAAEGAVVGDWINMGNFHWPPPPSGSSPTAPSKSDIAFYNSGVDFNFPTNTPAVKYLRISVGRTWHTPTLAHIIEVSFYGIQNL